MKAVSAEVRNDSANGEEAHKAKVVVHVNEQAVSLEKHHATGDEIKAAAIAQGVEIQQNFVLMRDLGGGQTEAVGDSERIKIDDDSRFVAIDPDDNS